MKLTKAEKEICKKYSARDSEGFVHCDECPLNILDSYYGLECYATIDGRSVTARGLKRYEAETGESTV